MKRLVLFFMVAAPANSGAPGTDGPHGYLVGGIIALLILGYLIYSLIRPEKF
jgi:K+-transporting ATPase KdpF subunit